MTRFAFLILSLLLFTACTEPTTEKVEESYPDGAKKVVYVYQGEGNNAVRVGQKEYFPDGQLRVEGDLKDNKREGVWTAYYDDGTKWSQNTYKAGKKEGPGKAWFKNGNVRFEGKYVNDEKKGTWNYYDESGALAKTLEH